MNNLQQTSAKDWAPFFLRVPLAVYFMFEGFWWMLRPEKLAQVLHEQASLPSGVFFSIYTTLTPYLLIIAGILIFFGFLTTLGALLACLVYFPPLFTSGVFTFSTELLTRRSGAQNIVFLFAAFSLLFSGPGPLSIDSLLQARGK